MKNVVKILTALATIAGAVYIIATYGEQIVAWAKKIWNSLPQCPEAEAEEVVEVTEEVAEEAAEAAEEPAEEVAAEEVEEPAPEVVVAEHEPVAEENDFAE